MSETKLREQICAFSRSLFERGLTAGSSGNVSVRLEDGGWLMTPTNASLGFLDPARLSRLDSAGRLLSGDAPSKEIPLHQALYDGRKQAGAIVHLHSVHSVAVSMLPEIDPADVLPPLTAYYVMRVGATALLPYYRPGDSRPGRALRGGAAGQPRPGGGGGQAGGGDVRHRGAGGDRAALPDAARPEPARPDAGAGR